MISGFAAYGNMGSTILRSLNLAGESSFVFAPQHHQAMGLHTATQQPVVFSFKAIAGFS